jgi:hypothetical protein
MPSYFALAQTAVDPTGEVVTDESIRFVGGGVELRYGFFNFSMAGAVQAEFTYAFPRPFSAVPKFIQLQCENPSNLIVLDTQHTNWTKDGFTVIARYADNIGKNGLCLVYWFALGNP